MVLKHIIKSYLHTQHRKFSSSASSVLAEILHKKQNYGFDTEYFTELKKEKIIVEFSSPNIAKKFHAGHLRSTITGNFVSNLLEHAGHDVIRINYLGDWGKQFAMLYIGFNKYGNEKDLKSSPLKHLLDVYVKVNKAAETDPEIELKAREAFYEMEFAQKSKGREFWKHCREMSLIEYKKLYERLNIQFDHYLFESMYVQESHNIIEKLQEREILQTKGEVQVVELANTSWYMKLKYTNTYSVLARSNGTGLYLTRDIASVLERKEKYNFDKIFYVVDMAQKDHFLQLFATLERMEFVNSSVDDNSLNHIKFGRVAGMKTRLGEVVFLDDILDTAIEHVRRERNAHKTTKDVSDESYVIENIALAGLICSTLKSKLSKTVKFSWESALANKGDTGTFLQYTHSRLCSLEQNCGLQIPSDITMDFNEAAELIKYLQNYPKACQECYDNLEPSILTKYLFKLCHLTATNLRNLKVKNESDVEVAKARLLLFHCTRLVLNNGLNILGITSLEKM